MEPNPEQPRGLEPNQPVPLPTERGSEKFPWKRYLTLLGSCLGGVILTGAATFLAIDRIDPQGSAYLATIFNGSHNRFLDAFGEGLIVSLTASIGALVFPIVTDQLTRRHHLFGT